MKYLLLIPEVFDVEAAEYGPSRVLFHLADIDDAIRLAPQRKVTIQQLK